MKEKSELLINSLNSIMGKTCSLYNVWAKNHGVNPYVSEILYLMKTAGICRQKDICEKSGMPKQTVNNVIAELVSNGYACLEIDPSDKRSRIITLTEKGELYSADAVDILITMENDVVKKIGEQRMRVLIDVLEQYDTLIDERMNYQYSLEKQSGEVGYND